MTEELDRALDRVSGKIDDMLAQRKNLIHTLRSILKIAEDREDTEESDDGSPRPNAWMQVAQMAREALETAGVVP